MRQAVKKPQLSESESWGFPVIWMVTNKYQCKNGALPTPLCQLFQIHGSIFKPHPSRNPGQTSVVCVTHGVFLFRICKNPLNGLFSLGINLLAQVGLSNALHNVQVFLPDVGCEYLLPFLVCLTAGFGWAVDTVFGGAAVDSFSVPVCCGMAKLLAVGTAKHIFYRGIPVSELQG